MKKKNLKLLFFLLLSTIFFLLNFSLFSEVKDPFIGLWIMPDEKVAIEISRKETVYEGVVVWLKYPTYPKGDSMEGVVQFDRNNPDPLLRKREVMGLKVVGDLKLDSNTNKLIDGWIYDSWNGGLYHGSVSIVDDNTLKLKGSFDKWGILGYNMVIKRFKLE